MTGGTVYYTVHGVKDYPKYSSGASVGCVADDFGITQKLGFRPRWCSGLYADSLADSWFSIWTASPQYIEEISFINSDDAVPIDALTWTQLRQDYMDLPQGEPGWFDELERIFEVEGVPRWRLEYLVPDDLDEAFSIPASVVSYPEKTAQSDTLLNIFSKLFSYDDEGLDGQVEAKLAEIFTSIHEASAIQLAAQNIVKKPLDIETAYRFHVQLNGIAALLWRMGTGGALPLSLCGITINDLGGRKGGAYDKAQELLQRWDKAPQEFEAEDFDNMHSFFLEALSYAAETKVRQDMPNIGRNDLCPCGSGMKFKQCHGARHELDWYTRREERH